MIYQQKFKNTWLLWFKLSNSYSAVNHQFKTYIDIYKRSISFEDFKSQVVLPKDLNPKALYQQIKLYLEACEIKSPEPTTHEFQLDLEQRCLTFSYQFKNILFSVSTTSLEVSQLFLPALAHLKLDHNSVFANCHFDIQVQDNHLCLFFNDSLVQAVPKSDYHLIQGKFIFTLLNRIYSVHEKDWLGTLHGSTIAKNKHSVMLIGNSGNGKSTACALLTAHGYELVADDLSPLSTDKTIYHNPFGISIKSGALPLLTSYFNELSQLQEITYNSSKGSLKYLPTKPPKATNYKCKALILVNYSPDSATSLKSTSIASILEPLIPDSWLSPKPEHALAFMQWLQTQEFYQLIYSNHNEMVAEMNKLFDSFNTI